jgi:hypothetical protein
VEVEGGRRREKEGEGGRSWKKEGEAGRRREKNAKNAKTCGMVIGPA